MWGNKFMSKRLIGYGYTNANGVATLDYDAEGNELQSSGYVGQGVGNVDISASAVIDGSTFVSVPYEVIDGIVSDINGVGNIDYRNPVGAGIDRSGGKTVFTAQTVGTMVYCQISLNHTQNYNFNNTGEFVVAFDVLEYTGIGKLEVTANNGSTTHWLTSRDFAETGHYEYFFKENEQYLMFKGTKIPLNNRTLSDYTTSIYVSFDTDNSLTVNNVVVYPI